LKPGLLGRINRLPECLLNASKLQLGKH
jgi:hypothetical protein